MYRIYIGNATTESDYTQYVVANSVSIVRSLNVPSTCTLTLSNNDGTFVLPAERSYIRIYSEQYQRSLFTGFLTNDPTRNFLGVGLNQSFGGQQFNFQLQFTSDEYLLNIKSVNFIPAFINQTQGNILRTIAETLCPGFYDFSYCASGNIIPSFTYDPSQSWSQIAKTFCDGSRYRYSAVDKQIHFQPYGDGQLGIRYDEDAGQGSFDPYSLTTSATTTPIVNDVTIIGQQEAGNSREDHFIGDGFVGAFPLRHKLFGLADSQSGSSILLSDSWNETSVNTQNWLAQDPSNNFNFGLNSTQALNILTGIANPPGSSFIAANNALELAGGVVMQHGEFVFNDFSSGIIGGVYDSTILNSFNNLLLDENTCETGFIVVPTANIQVTASGAAGISIQPFRLGAVPAKAFQVITKVNCSYTLTSSITAPAPSRYTQLYTTLGGVSYGGTSSQNVNGNLTWSVVETNNFTGVQTNYTFTVADQTLPVTAIYVLIDNYRLNVTITTTYITAPIPGSLHATCKVGAGLLAPIYISGNVQYTGAFVTPSGGNLPILPSDFGPENSFQMSTSLQQQAAEIDSGQVTDALNFYGDDLPGVGVRIRLQSWESQAAVSRVQDPVSIATEATIVGDNGLRASVISNLNPLPRTSEDCDFAGQAFLDDRTRTFYQGTYNASFYFFKPQIDDIDLYPVCGRYLFINSPRRNIVKQNFLVTGVTTTLGELKDEICQHNITFGPDLFLDKLLAALIPQPATILTPLDTVIQPTPQALASIGTNYLPDVQQTTISSLNVSGAAVTMSMLDALPQNAHFEIRNADLNWGKKDGRLIASVPVSGDIILPRSSYDQTWYIRMVETVNTQVISSRRTRAIRVYYPQVPSAPAYVKSDSSQLFFDFAGDIRNIEGIELRGTNTIGLPWQASGNFVPGISIIDSNGNIEQALASLTVGITTSQVVPVSGQSYSYLFLDVDTVVTGLMYDTQMVRITGLTGPLTFINNIFVPLTIVGPQRLRFNVFGVAPKALGTDTGTAAAAGSTTNIAGPIMPMWSTISGTLTYDNGVAWVNKGISVPITQVFYRAIVGSEFDMDLQLSILRNQLSPGQTSTGPIGQFQVNVVPANARNFAAYFFNLMWEYSPGTFVHVPPPSAPTLSIGYSFGSALQLLMKANDPVPRADIQSTTLQIANSNIFNASTIISQTTSVGAPGTFTTNVPVSGDLYARASMTDLISSGGWSNVFHIPQGNLISSAYLAGQGSTPPIITNSSNTSGGLFTYTSKPNSITIASAAFGVIYPNGAIDNVPAQSQTYTISLDTGVLQPATTYGFFPSLKGPTTATPSIDFDGPYLNYTTTGVTAALQIQFADGSAPLVNGAFIATTAAAGGNAGGGGGGTGGGGNCGEVTRKILCSDNVRRQLKDISVNQLVINLAGRLSRVVEKSIFLEETVAYKTESGLETETAFGHILFCRGEWRSLADILMEDATQEIRTDNSLSDRLVEVIIGEEKRYICRISLEPIDKENATDEDHVYNLDGIWTHNTLIKNGSAS